MNNGRLNYSEVAQLHGIKVGRRFLPGRFYSLKINSPFPNLGPDEVDFLSEGKSYYDLNPVGLCLYYDGWIQTETVLMLNLKVIPPQVASKLLEAYYRFSWQNGLASLFDSEGTLLPSEERQLMNKPFYAINGTILSNLLGIRNLNFAINKYNIDSIADVRLIDFDKFGMLVRPRLSSTGLFPDPFDLSQTYEDFITNSIE